MKLYVLNKNGPGKVFLKAEARTRSELAQRFGGTALKINGITYQLSEVNAEKGEDNTSIGMVVGGVIGALGGGAGVAAGGLIGALIGKEKDRAEEEKVAQFNGSKA